MDWTEGASSRGALVDTRCFFVGGGLVSSTSSSEEEAADDESSSDLDILFYSLELGLVLIMMFFYKRIIKVDRLRCPVRFVHRESFRVMRCAIGVLGF